MPSTVIRHYEYDPAVARLTIMFVNGRAYAYFDVPPGVVADFDSAFSKGEFFNSQIRDKYRYREIMPVRG